jgi:hypothetical protein
MTSDALLELHSSWPGTTIDGEPGIVSGTLEVSCAPDGGVYLNLSVGVAGAAPEESIRTLVLRLARENSS